MSQPISSVCVFCGSSIGSDPAYAADAELLGRLIAHSGRRLVFGGGNVGLMGIVSNSAYQAGGPVIGIIPRFLKEIERPTGELTELIITSDMHERKRLMWENADAFFVLPGGVGTLEELMEQITWEQLGQHKKPIILINTLGYWETLERFFRQMRREGFIRPDLEINYQLADTPAQAIALLDRA